MKSQIMFPWGKYEKYYKMSAEFFTQNAALKWYFNMIYNHQLFKNLYS